MITPAAAYETPDAEVEAETAAAGERVRVAEESFHRHALVNAMTAIEGAASILASDRLGPEDRGHISRLLVSGVERLRSLVDGGDHGPATVDLATVAFHVSRDEQWAGRVQVDVGLGLVAVGSAAHIAEAVRQLLEWGGAVAPTGSLVLRGRREADGVCLWVEAGASPPPALGVPVTEVPVTGVPVAVQVAARLVRDQGGAVRVAEGRGGVALIGICLPSATDGGAGGDGDGDA